MTGPIGPATTEYLRHGLKAASEKQASLIILRMDTPGGLDTAMREIVRDILVSPTPILTYVSPSGARAASAGTYILYASHLAAMAPGTNLGAATPVQLGGGERPPSGSGESEEKRSAASLPAKEALEKGVIEILASDIDDLLRQANGRVVRVGQQSVKLDTTGLALATFEPDWRTRLLGVITHPNIAFMLLIVGIYGVILESMSPGAVLPGVIGAICLVVGLFALNLLPINYAGIGLIVLGIALMAAEAVTPSFGVLGFGGAAAFTIGSIFLFEGEVPGLNLSPAVIVTAAGFGAVFALLAGTAAVRTRRHPIVTGNSTLVGCPAEVLSWAGTRGQVEIHGERWQARATAPLAPGQRVRVVGREGLSLVVEPEAEQKLP